MASPVNEKDKKEITQVATIAGNNDPTIGAVLADAFVKVGKNGVITVEEGKQSETTVDVVEGMQFDRGFLSPHFVTNQDEQTVEFEKCLVLIHEEKISNAKNLIPLLETVSKAGKPLLIIAEDIEGEALATLVVNKLRGILNVVAVKAPGYGDRRKAMLGDIAALTGANAIFKDLGVTLESVKLSDLGTAKKVTSHPRTRRSSAAAAARRPSTAGRIRFARRSRRPPATTTARSSQERLAKLAGGVAQINVGAATETEMKERKALMEDARAATKAALRGGHRARRRRGPAPQRKGPRQAGTDRRRGPGGEDRPQRASAPMREIAENAGQDGAVVVNRVRQMKGKADGYDADKDAYCDLVEAGIIDPAKVVRTALQNAASVAALLLTTSCLVTDIPKEEEPAGPAPAVLGMGGGMGGMGGMGGGMGGWKRMGCAWPPHGGEPQGRRLRRPLRELAGVPVGRQTLGHIRRNKTNQLNFISRKRTMKEINLRPLDDRVVVEPVEAEEMTAGGIVLPDTAKEKPQRGTVLAVGPGKLLDSGERGKLSVAVGDEVIYGKYSGTRTSSKAAK